MTKPRTEKLPPQGAGALMPPATVVRQELYHELSRLNSESIHLQRQLRKRNAEIDELNRQIEELGQNRQAFETHLAQLSARFVNLPGRRLAAEIGRSLGPVRRLLGVARMATWRLKGDPARKSGCRWTKVAHPTFLPAA